MSLLKMSLAHPDLAVDPRPFPLMSLTPPPYRVGRYGEWTLVKHADTVGAVGYYRGLRVIEGHVNFALQRSGTVWMSLSPMELESQSLHLHCAHGEVVVAGLGMGALAYSLLQKPDVTRVTVVERDPEIIELLYKICTPRQWPNITKLDIRLGDALHYRHDRPVDVLVADIWPYLADTRAQGDMIQMQSQVQATLVGWWGQEYDIVAFLSGKGRSAPMSLDDLALYRSEVGLPIMGPDVPGYPELVVDAIVNGLHPLTKTASAIVRGLDPTMTIADARRRGLHFRKQPFQWHLTTTAHDKCPECGGSDIGNLGARDRVCLSEACRITGRSWRLSVSPATWFRSMLEAGEPVAFTKN